jgi:hypothetical protein
VAAYSRSIATAYDHDVGCLFAAVGYSRNLARDPAADDSIDFVAAGGYKVSNDSGLRMRKIMITLLVLMSAVLWVALFIVWMLIPVN